jgi:hypothetical protein
MGRYLAYKKDGAFDIEKGFIDESCFKEKDDEEIKSAFGEEGFDLKFIDQSQFEELSGSKNDPLKNAKTIKCNEVKFLRKSYQFQTINYQGFELSTSQMARQNMLSILNANEPSNSKYYWQDEAGKAQSFTLDNFKEILKNISTRDSKLYYIEAQINAEISLNNNPAAIEKLNIKELWKSYEDNYSKQN